MVLKETFLDIFKRYNNILNEEIATTTINPATRKPAIIYRNPTLEETDMLRRNNPHGIRLGITEKNDIIMFRDYLLHAEVEDLLGMKFKFRGIYQPDPFSNLDDMYLVKSNGSKPFPKSSINKFKKMIPDWNSKVYSENPTNGKLRLLKIQFI